MRDSMFHTLWRIGRNPNPAPAGFIHLPLECTFPTAHAVAALEAIVADMLSHDESPDPAM